MLARYVSICGVIGLICGLVSSLPQASAAPPWELINFKRVEADPQKAYDLSERNGPWMIMVATFAGDDALNDARLLTLDLRKNFKVEAYTHAQKFDFSKPVAGLGFTPEGLPRQMRYKKGGELNEVAVLIGNFTRVDESEAQKTLAKIKAAVPDSLKQTKSLAFAEYRKQLEQKAKSAGANSKDGGPLARAFITRNPLLPQEYFTPKGVDKFVLDMNKGVEHSLLDCPGKYSLVVATFKGAVLIDQRTIQAVNQGKTLESRLDQAADRAHRLTEMLREKGYEAYEFHDRESSIVTFGSFDSLGTPRADGKIEADPRLHKAMQFFGAEGGQSTPLPGQTVKTDIKSKSVGGILFDVRPAPIEVPKRSLATDYVRH